MKIKYLLFIIVSIVCTLLFFSSCDHLSDTEDMGIGQTGGADGEPPRAMRINDVSPVLQSDSLVYKTIESE